MAAAACMTNLKPTLSSIVGPEVKLFLIDFVINNETVDKNVKHDCEKLHEQLINGFHAPEVQLGQTLKLPNNSITALIHSEMEKCTWTIEIMCNSLIPSAKSYNEYFENKKIIKDIHNMVFVCIDRVDKDNCTLFKTYFAGKSFQLPLRSQQNNEWLYLELYLNSKPPK
ncbi:unnamed protein product, partial [Didymodactylos carnosus]